MANNPLPQTAFASPLSLFSRVTTARTLCRVRCATLGNTTPLLANEPVRIAAGDYSVSPLSCASNAATVIPPPSQTLAPQTVVSPTPHHPISPFAMSSLAEERARRAVKWNRSMSTINSKLPTSVPSNSDPLTNSTSQSNTVNQVSTSSPAPEPATPEPEPVSDSPPSIESETDSADDVLALSSIEESPELSSLGAKLTQLAKLRSGRRSRRANNALVEERAAGLQYSSHAEFVTDVLALRGDPLESDGGRVVVFRGNPSARLMVVGEGPGAEEDRLGLPFVGAAGQLLDRVLRYAGFDVDRDVYVTNVVKRRPRGNRDPSTAELAFYTPLLREEVRLVKPSIVVLAGRFAMQALLPDLKSITKARGRLFPLPGGGVAIPIYHPAFLLRNPDAKAHMQEDALVIRDKYLELNPGAPLDEVRNQGSGQR